MDEMEYGDSEDWPTAADGSGASLAKRHAGSPSGPADNWTFSFEIGGTPGTVNFPNAHLAGGERPGGAPVVFGEVSAADRAAFFCELSNPSAGSAALEGLRIRSSSGGSFRFGAEFLSAGGWRVLGTNELGFAVRSGDRLFLDDGPGGHVLDAVRVTREGRARSTIETGAPFRVPTRATPGEANVFAFHGEIVVNEIFYHAPLRSPAVDEQWIELFNRSDRSVDLSGWRLSDDVEFRFPDGARLASGSYCVVTGDATALERRYPGIAVYGNWTKRLGGRGGRIRLVDADGNPADDVRYFDDDPWPARADGGGSSLELRDPRTDNAVSGAWAASDESGRATWKVYTYRARAVTPVKAPAQNGFHEFRMGLLADGEVWVDDVSVVENPDGARRELMQNGGFDGPRSWRFLGNHGRSSVIDDPEVAGNRILRLVATDARGYMHNQLESTLKAGGVVVPVVTGRTYEISFRAKWIGGSPLLHTELYYNKVARTTVLETPDRHGTPGRPNSMAVTNSGPSFYGLRHEPLSPKPGEAVTVRVRAEDPDGIASMELYTSVNGGAWQRRTMVGGDGGEFVASVPGNTVDSVVQFYVSGRDRRGASAFEPAGGPASRACYRVDTRV
ncbi:MAG: lamin tail domain-containing protein, partial [Verrucomicrobiales bacterium]|nr:lamin tail domain-containing protein [Verrucomicrobiales bacterium]